MIDSQPDLAPLIRRVRGGYLKIQGTWMPYEVCPSNRLHVETSADILLPGGSATISTVSASRGLYILRYNLMFSEWHGQSAKTLSPSLGVSLCSIPSSCITKSLVPDQRSPILACHQTNQDMVKSFSQVTVEGVHEDLRSPRLQLLRSHLRHPGNQTIPVGRPQRLSLKTALPTSLIGLLLLAVVLVLIMGTILITMRTAITTHLQWPVLLHLCLFEIHSRPLLVINTSVIPDPQ